MGHGGQTAAGGLEVFLEWVVDVAVLGGIAWLLAA